MTTTTDTATEIKQTNVVDGNIKDLPEGIKFKVVEISEQELKTNIEKVVQESFNKCKQNQFRDIEYFFLDKKSQSKTLKQKLEIFHSLDRYSKTFLSIHTKTKAALREINSNKFEGEYLELLRLILTLDDKLIGKKLKSLKTRSKEPVDLNTIKSSNPETNKAIDILKVINTMQIVVTETSPNPISKVEFKSNKSLNNKYNIKDNTQIIKEDVTGKNLNKRTKKSKQLIKGLDNLNL